MKELSVIPKEGIRVTWLGHSTLLIQMERINLLTDPMFSERSGPVKSKFVPKRYRPVPCSINDLPKIDAVIISHSCYDHLDTASVKQLNDRFGSDLVWFVPKQLKTWLTDTNCISVIELDWWEEAFMRSPEDGKEISFVFTPAQFWSKRNLTDNNKVKPIV